MSDLYTDIFIELHVPDFETAKRFYSDLGYTVSWERKPIDQKGYMVMKNGKSIINFFCGNEHVYEQSYFNKFSKDTKRGYAVEIVILRDDIQKLYEEVGKKYSDLIVEPLEKRFDRMDFRMEDPFGFYIRFVERYNWVDGRDREGNKIDES